MVRKYFGKAVVVLFSLCFGFGLVTESPAATAAKKYLSFGTGNPGGIYYFLGAGFASLFNKYVPEIRVVAESTGAGEENFHYMVRKKMDMGFSGASSIQAALEKKLDISGIRLISMGHTSERHWFVRKDSPVKCVADFKGRRVAVGNPGSGVLLNTRRELKDAAGLTFENIKPAYLSYTEAVSATRDGTIDVGTVSAGHPVPSLLDLARQIPFRLIPYSEEEMTRLIAKNPDFVKAIIPRGTYQGVDTDTLTRGSVICLFCRQDLSEDLVYKMMKALFEHPKEKDMIHPQAKQWNLQNIFRGADYITKYIPFHPGVVKYLKEKGLWKGEK